MFSSKSQLHAHIKFQHSNQLYKCTKCPHKFSTQSELKSNELVFHEWSYGAVSVTKKTETKEETLETDDGGYSNTYAGSQGWTKLL